MRIQTDNFGSADHFRARLHERSYDYELHLHQFAEVMLVLDGEIEVTVGDKTEVARSGQFIFIFPFRPHAYKTRTHSTTFCAVFSESLLPDFFAKCAGKAGERAAFDASEAHLALWQSALIPAYAKDKSFTPSPFAVKSALYAMVADFERQILLSPAERSLERSDMIISYLTEHSSSPISLSDMAKALGYAENYLSHKITALFGMNFPTLLACLRVERAKRLLRESHATILEIAMECGFGSERSFDRAFKKITGGTPSEYRKNL